MINFFQGGPQNGTSYESDDLLTDHELAESIEFENYTAGDPYVDVEGRDVRIWTHISIAQPAEPVTRRDDLGDLQDETPVEVEVPAETVTGFTEGAPETEAVDTEATQFTLTFEQRRKRAKQSRESFASFAGLTASAVYRVEKGKGKPEEVATYESAISSIENVA